jgi:hypothetical protein
MILAFYGVLFFALMMSILGAVFAALQNEMHGTRCSASEGLETHVKAAMGLRAAPARAMARPTALRSKQPLRVLSAGVRDRQKRAH